MEIQLTELGVGKSAVIKEIKGEYGFQKRLTSLGIRDRKTVRKLGSGAFKGPIIVEVDRVKIAIGRGIAKMVLVEELQV